MAGMLSCNRSQSLPARTTRLLILILAVTPAAAIQGSPLEPVQQPAEAQSGQPIIDDVVVVTASRREEQLLNAPATMTVLSEDAIGKAPVQSVTDLLRLVPGVNTVQSSARDVNVTSRTATGTLADSLLVLLDGRSIYLDFFGFVAWDFLPVDAQEIKQIEVIRGPASAVWGANAMTGVINVITKPPREMQGTSLAIRFGQFDRSRPESSFDSGGIFSVSATHARATSDRFAYKISAGVLTHEPFLRPTGNVPGTATPYPPFENRGTTQPKLDARADYDLEDGRQKIILAGGIAGTEGIVHTGIGPLDVRRGSTFKYGRMTYTRDKLKLQGFVNALDGESPPLLQRGLDGQPLDFRFENQAYDVEFSNLHLLHGSHLVSYGGNYRHNNFDLSFARRGDNRDEGGAYVQDEIFISDQYRWIVGGRIDRFDVLKKAVLSPRTTFLIKPRPSHTIRLSFNRAFRAPSFVNSFLDTSFVTQQDLGPGTRVQFTTAAVGNTQLKEEALTAYEAGYIGGIARTTIGAAVYLNRTRNVIQFTQTAFHTSANPPPGWPLAPAVLDQLIAQGHGLPSRFTYLNFNRITDHGVELSVDVRVMNGVAAFANYTWQADPKPAGFDVSELNLPPRHRFNAGATITRGRYFGSLSGSFVGAAFWQDVLPGYQGRTYGYTLVDGGFGVHSADGAMSVAVRGTNLLNKPAQQHVFGDVIKRAMTGEVRFAF
jgi:outer membrane receptor protein involved in Fe transport